MNADKKRLSKELKEAHHETSMLATLVSVGETPPGDGDMKTHDSKEMKLFLMSKNIVPLQFEIDRDGVVAITKNVISDHDEEI